jgi:IS5 family transposase
MRQQTLASQVSFERYGKKTRREKFLEEMDVIMPWSELESMLEPYYPKEGNGRPPVGLSCLGRGRDTGRPIPPAEIPTSGTTA